MSKRESRHPETVWRWWRRRKRGRGDLFIKGPQATLDWLVECTDIDPHPQALEELRAIAGDKAG